jgi:hypothetical protein
MTVTVTWLQSDVDALSRAIASGTLSVEYDGPPKRSVVYQNIDEMKRILAQIVAEANAATRKRVRYVATKKGV